MPAISYVLPILLIIFSNTFYNIIAKATPGNANALASLFITYLTAAAATFVLLLFSLYGKDISLPSQFSNLNWTSVALGVVIVGLEFGYIMAYRAGWNISICSLVANISLAVILLIIGVLFYKEHISFNQFIGIALCLLGLFFINR